MRLDNFLKWSRLIRRRVLVKEMCEAGDITVNNARARPSKTIRAGDRIEIAFWNKALKVEVTTIPEPPVSKKEAASLYRVVSEERVGPFSPPIL